MQIGAGLVHCVFLQTLLVSPFLFFPPQPPPCGCLSLLFFSCVKETIGRVKFQQMGMGRYGSKLRRQELDQRLGCHSGVTLFLTLSPNGRGQQLAGLLHRDKPGRGALRRGVLQGVPRTGELCVRLCRPRKGVGFLGVQEKRRATLKKCEAPVVFLRLEGQPANAKFGICWSCGADMQVHGVFRETGVVAVLSPGPFMAWRLGSVASGFCHVDRGWALGIPSRACSWRRPRRFSPDGSPRRWEECENPQKRLAGFGVDQDSCLDGNLSCVEGSLSERTAIDVVTQPKLRFER